MSTNRAVFSLTERAHMRAALDAARNGTRGANPLVGAVLVPREAAGSEPDVAQVAIGWHRGAGTAHAEPDAIRRAREMGIDTRGATLFVTLEPCTHTGRTGPCSQAIIDAGIARVIFAAADPNPAAAGGAALLETAGIEVQHGLLADEALELNARWFASIPQGRPFITAKIAQSIDGRVAAVDGTSKWITSPAARAHAHELRSVVDAIAVGTGTALADNPKLTARNPNGTWRESQPVPVVFGSRELPSDLVIARNPHLIRCTGDLETELGTLFDAGIRHLLVEGGPTLVSSFLARGLVDELQVYIAPLVLGAGKNAVGDIGTTTLAHAHGFVVEDTHPLGPDIFVRMVPTASAATTAAHSTPATA